MCRVCKTHKQKVDDTLKVEEVAIPKLRKVSITPKEEPVKKEVKKTKVKIPKAKKYEELPEIPDYERPQLEVYEESEFNQSKAGERTQLERPSVQPLQATEHTAPVAAEPTPPERSEKVPRQTKTRLHTLY